MAFTRRIHERVVRAIPGAQDLVLQPAGKRDNAILALVLREKFLAGGIGGRGNAEEGEGEDGTDDAHGPTRLHAVANRRGRQARPMGGAGIRARHLNNHVGRARMLSLHDAPTGKTDGRSGARRAIMGGAGRGAPSWISAMRMFSYSYSLATFAVL